jgi:hypothetical protein
MFLEPGEQVALHGDAEQRHRGMEIVTLNLDRGRGYVSIAADFETGVNRLPKFLPALVPRSDLLR